jgi:transcription initiation factor TFIID subunit 7
MKLKLKNPDAAASDAPATPQDDATQPPPVKVAGLKIKLKPVAPGPLEPPGSQSGDALKSKRKYHKKAKLDEGGNSIFAGKSGPRKRAREDGEDLDSPAAKRKSKPTAKSLAMTNESDDDDEFMATAPAPAPIAPPVRTHSIKLSLKSKGPGSGVLQRTGTAILKVKGAGKPPTRPFGVGYDSEAEEAELDPAIESQFVLRMLPGEDCDLLRKAIEEKQIGKSVAQGGPGVYYRFFDREGRRAMVTIQGRSYAASMVELPTVIETMKSWNKRDWVKTADVCQMLLVLGRVHNEDEAKKFPRPPLVEPDSHRYPHGLTPPMRWVRKLRFRPRKSYLDVERAEAQMDRLLAEDENARSSKYELVNSDHESSEDESDDEDADGDEEMLNAQIPDMQEDEMDAGDLEQMLAEGLMQDEDVQIQADDDTMAALFGDENMEPATPATAHDVAMHALQQGGSITVETETAASTPAAATSADDDDDDDDGSDEDEVDDDAIAEEQRKEQLRGEIVELVKGIKENEEARDRQSNHIYKKRMQNQIDKQKADLEIKRNQLGEDVAED